MYLDLVLQVPCAHSITLPINLFGTLDSKCLENIEKSKIRLRDCDDFSNTCVPKKNTDGKSHVGINQNSVSNIESSYLIYGNHFF